MVDRRGRRPAGRTVGRGSVTDGSYRRIAPAHRCARLQPMSLHEWTVAGGLIETPDGVLLVRNQRRGGFEDWSTPGGVIDADDADLLAGLTREVEEETGLRVREWSGPLYEVHAVRARHGLAHALRGASRGRVRGRAARRRPRRHRRRGRVRPAARVRRDRLASCAPWVREPLSRVVARTVGAGRGARRSTTRCTARRAIDCAWCARERTDCRDRRRRSCTSTSTRSTRRSSSSTTRRCAARPVIVGGLGNRGVVCAASYEARALRRPLRDADGPGAAGVPARRVPLAPLRALLREEPRGDGDPRVGDAARRAALDRRGVPRRRAARAGCSGAGPRSRRMLRDARPRRDRPHRVGRRRVDEVPRQARERPREARRPARRAGRDRARVPRPAAGDPALGRRPRDVPTARPHGRAHDRRRRARRPSRRSSARSATRSVGTCTRSRTTTTTAPSSPSTRREVDRRRGDVRDRPAHPRPRANASSCGSPTACSARLRTAGLGARTVTLKIRFGDFETKTRARTLPEATDLSTRRRSTTARELLAEFDVARGIRLLGVSLSQLAAGGAVQQAFALTLDDASVATSARRAPRRARDRRSTRCATASVTARSARPCCSTPTSAGDRTHDDDPDRARRLRPHRHRARVRDPAAGRRGAGRRRARPRPTTPIPSAPRASPRTTAASRPRRSPSCVDAVDVVWVCTWTAAHLEAVAAAADAGRPVFCEKPLAPTLASVRACRRRARARPAPGRAGAALRAGVRAPRPSSSRRGRVRPAARDRSSATTSTSRSRGMYGSTWRKDVAAAGRRHAHRALDPRHRRAALAARRPGHGRPRTPPSRFGHSGHRGHRGGDVRLRRRLGRAADERVAPGADPRVEPAPRGVLRGRVRCGPTTTTSARCTSRPSDGRTRSSRRRCPSGPAASTVPEVYAKASPPTPRRPRRSSTRSRPVAATAVGHPSAGDGARRPPARRPGLPRPRPAVGLRNRSLSVADESSRIG